MVQLSSIKVRSTGLVQHLSCFAWIVEIFDVFGVVLDLLISLLLQHIFFVSILLLLLFLLSELFVDSAAEVGRFGCDLISSDTLRKVCSSVLDFVTFNIVKI